MGRLSRDIPVWRFRAFALTVGLWVALSGGGVAAPTPRPSPSPTPMERTLSVSGQFVIYGGNRKMRSEMARRVEELSEMFFSVAGIPEDWKWPIIFKVSPNPRRDPPRPKTTLLLGDGDTLRIQVDFPEDGLSSASLLETAALRALALEFMFRDARPTANKAITLPPDWLVEGLWQESSTKRDGIPSALFERLIQGGPPPKLETFLRQRPETLDATSRAIYRAQAMTLLRALLASRGGRASLSAYLSGLHAARAEDPAPLLAAFPGLSEHPAELAKLWTLEIARLSATGNLDTLSIEETDQRLAKILNALQSTVPTKKPEEKPPSGVAALPVLAKEKAGRYVLTQKVEELLLLEARAHPLSQPLVEGYRTLAAELAIKPRRSAEKRIAALEELRGALRTRGSAISDYLNWFEVTQFNTASQDFPEDLVRPSEDAVPRRTDAVSRALDAVEATRELP